MTIVLARVEEDRVIVKHGRTDLGEQHKFKTVPKPIACVWLLNGKESDVEKARNYAASEGYTVFCYEAERDPLGKAKRDILK